MATYNDDKSYASSGVGTAGLTLGVIGTALASGIVGNFGNGLFGNNGGNSQVASLMMENSVLKAAADTDKKLVDVYSTLRLADKNQDANVANLASRVLALETAAPLREQIVVDKIQALANSTADNFAASNLAISNLSNTIANLTKTIIPITNVCPQPMPQYNSWTAPTTPTTAG